MNEPNISKQFGVTVKQVMDQKKLTRREFSIMTGIAYGTLQNIESGKTSVSIDNAAIISMALDCPIQTLLGDLYDPPELKCANVKLLLQQFRRIVRSILATANGKNAIRNGLLLSMTKYLLSLDKSGYVLKKLGLRH